MNCETQDDWMLEEGDEDAESYPVEEISEQTIREALLTCYASLYEQNDEARIIAMGESNRRIVEIQTPKGCEHFVLTLSGVDIEPDTIQVGSEVTFNVSKNEVLTVDHAFSAFIEFLRTKRIPTEFELIKKSYYWCDT
jgi:hypothetical protein